MEFDCEPVYGDNDKYMKTQIKLCASSMITNVQRKTTMQVFINKNARFCYQSKEKVLSSDILGRMQIRTRKDKNGEPY